MLIQKTSKPFGRETPRITNRDALAGVGRITRAIAKDTFQTGIGTRKLGCDGLPMLSLQSGVGCAVDGGPGIPVNVLRSNGKTIQLPGALGIGSVGGSSSSMITIGAGPLLNCGAALRAGRRFVDDNSNLWGPDGSLISTGDPATPAVVQLDDYLTNYSAGIATLNGTTIGTASTITGYFNNERGEDPYFGDQAAIGLCDTDVNCWGRNNDMVLSMESRFLTDRTGGLPLPTIRHASDLSFVCRFDDPSDTVSTVDTFTGFDWYMVTADPFGLWWVQQMAQPVIRAYAFVRSTPAVVLIETVTFSPDPGYGYQRRAQPIYL